MFQAQEPAPGESPNPAWQSCAAVIALVVLVVVLVLAVLTWLVARWRAWAPLRRERDEALHDIDAAIVVTEEAATAVDRALGEMTAAEAARRAAAQEKRLETLPVSALRDATEEPLRLGPMEQAGIRTVADVLRAGETKLDAIAGIGPGTARNALVAATRLKGALDHEPIALSTDPRSWTSDDLRTIAAARSYIEARSTVGPIAADARAAHDHLTAARQRVKKSATFGRFLLGRQQRHDAIRAEIAVADTQLAEPATQQAVHEARTRVERFRLLADQTEHARTQDPKEIERDWRERNADYVAALEQAVLVGAVPRPPRGIGGVPAEIAARVEAQPLQVDGLKVTLRGYQRFGVQYLLTQGRTILGDEMGLGKTIQALGAMVHLHAAHAARRFLVVAPASLAENWRREVGTRTELEPHVLLGDERALATRAFIERGGVGITSYNTLPALGLPRELDLDMAVVDEAHYVKNPAAARTKAVRDVGPRASYLTLMTGTPLENNVEEFVELVRTVDDDLARQLNRDFEAGIVRLGGRRSEFLERVAPVYLRRNQEDVLTELPERLEVEEWVTLAPEQEAAYAAAVADRNFMAMRRAATIAPGGAPSTKLDLLEDTLEEYREEGRKVVIYSFFLDVLDAVAARFGARHQLRGEVSPAERTAAIDAFTASDGHDLLLCQIDVGGVGINLQAASAVVLVEPQWKPTTEWQAIARAHRMGQTRRVVVHRLLAKDCVDERIVELREKKETIFDEVARDSAMKDATMAATSLAADATEAQGAQAIIEIERARLGIAAAGPTPGRPQQ